MKIAVINTGGTISCIGNPLAPMSAQDFASACSLLINPILQQSYPALQIHYVTDLHFPETKTGTIDSTNLQPSNWCLMADYILQHYTVYDGWVLLHGTDSLDFTGAALPFLLSSFDANGIQTAVLSKPIIITGSQKPLFYHTTSAQTPLALLCHTDALQNFSGAMTAAQSGIPEVCVYFHNTLYRGNRVLKTHANHFNAFTSPNYPTLAEYGLGFHINNYQLLPTPVSYAVSLDNPIVLEKTRQQLAAISASINQFPVMKFNAFPANYTVSASKPQALMAKLISACVAQGIKGLILESYGTGNFPSGNPDKPEHGAIYQALQQADAHGIIIVDCTQVISGTVNNSAYAAGTWLATIGALNPLDMTPMTAFAKLMILLASATYKQWNIDTVKQLMQLNLLGEMQDISRLNSRNKAELLVNQALTTLDGSAALVNDGILGPVLKTSTGTQLWRAIPSEVAQHDRPGRLIMQNNGNLVYYSRNNAALWTSNTGLNDNTPSVLLLSGSESNCSLSLQVYNYLDNTISRVLFTQTDAITAQTL